MHACVCVYTCVCVHACDNVHVCMAVCICSPVLYVADGRYASLVAMNATVPNAKVRLQFTIVFIHIACNTHT